MLSGVCVCVGAGMGYVKGCANVSEEVCWWVGGLVG